MDLPYGRLNPLGRIWTMQAKLAGSTMACPDKVFSKNPIEVIWEMYTQPTGFVSGIFRESGKPTCKRELVWARGVTGLGQGRWYGGQKRKAEKSFRFSNFAFRFSVLVNRKTENRQLSD